MVCCIKIWSLCLLLLLFKVCFSGSAMTILLPLHNRIICAKGMMTPSIHVSKKLQKYFRTCVHILIHFQKSKSLFINLQITGATIIYATGTMGQFSMEKQTTLYFQTVDTCTVNSLIEARLQYRHVLNRSAQKNSKIK